MAKDSYIKVSLKGGHLPKEGMGVVVHVIIVGVVMKCSCYHVVNKSTVTVTIYLYESQCEAINKDVRREF